MKLLKLRNIAMTGAMGVAGSGLVGAGAHAVFTQTTASSQSITSGTLSLVVTSPNSAACTTVADACTTLALAAYGPVGSSFSTGDQVITIHNVGNINAHVTGEAITNGDASSVLDTEANICEVDPNNYVDYNGVFSGAGSLGMNWDIPAGTSVSYKINVFAGGPWTTACGTTAFANLATAGPITVASLTNTAEGQSIEPVITYSFTG